MVVCVVSREKSEVHDSGSLCGRHRLCLREISGR